MDFYIPLNQFWCILRTNVATTISMSKHREMAYLRRKKNSLLTKHRGALGVFIRRNGTVEWNDGME